MLEPLFNVMNTKQSYPITDSITNTVEASIVVAATMSLIACEVTRHMGHALEGGVYKGARASWGIVKGAKQRLVSCRERISEKVNKARTEAVAVTDEEAVTDTPVPQQDEAPVVVPVVPVQQPVEEAPTPAGMPTPAFA